MAVSISQIVNQIGTDIWRMGSKIICERIPTAPTAPPNVLATWQDGNCTFILRPRSDENVDLASSSHLSEQVKLVHEGGTTSAVWSVGSDAFCKVKVWFPGLQSESDTIAFVQKHKPEIPVPEVVYSWIDQKYSFLILKRVQGVTLRNAWASFSPSQRESILNTTVHYCNVLASITSSKLESVSGGAVLEPFLAPPRTGPCSASWLLQPLSCEECIKYFYIPSSLNPFDSYSPDKEELFHFYHPDLGPGNIIVTEAGQVTGVIDWESAGFYPRFWIATKPSVSPGLDFHPPIDGIKSFEWRKQLRTILNEQGYPQASDWFMEWRAYLKNGSRVVGKKAAS